MTIGHGRAMERMVDQNARMVQASTWPYLTMAVYNSDLKGQPLYEAALENNGVGPARIRSITFAYGDHSARNGNDVARMIAAEAGVPHVAVLIHGIPGVLPAHGRVTLLSAQPGVSSPAMIAAMIHLGTKIRIQACYCSLFDDCWTMGLQQAGDPRPVRNCRETLT